MTARLLTILTLALPLTACAAQPGSGQAPAVAPAAATAAGQNVRAAEPAAPVPAAVQADSARQDTVQHHAEAGVKEVGNGVTAPTASSTRRAVVPATSARGNSAAGTSASGTSATGTSATGTSASGAAAPSTSVSGNSATETPATGAATAPADTATPAAPDVAAPRPTAPAATVPTVTMPSGSSTGSLLQTLFALILVLAVLGALAWFLKRYGPKVGGGNANVRVVGSLNLGGRERIVVVEVGNEWIVVGASPGRINALATMPRQGGQNGDNASANATLARPANVAPAAHSFADWLKQTIDKRK
ncbi:flagellar biosynthetic protein FliO [Massilia pinisoli]|uniref:Flagellar protein n=1 Tax=Massilia pinisoli TaxID=1772194 RepID=A0ABT1ZN36_9BURK|nr:flagellar biosynthetic protein FliO [Massilia pinisoli]MCS0581333.1 flagellar biosynthetic protein FliO [Massilia pinisoli]